MKLHFRKNRGGEGAGPELTGKDARNLESDGEKSGVVERTNRRGERQEGRKVGKKRRRE